MVDIKNTFLVVLVVSIIGFGTFFGFMGTSSSANDTNTTNLTDNTNSTPQSLTASVDPPSNATGYDPSVSISVTPSADFGTVIADGSEYNNSETQVNVSATEFLDSNKKLNDKLYLYTKASGDLNGAYESIPLSNLEYDGFSSSTLTKTPFSMDYAKVTSWIFNKQPGGGSYKEYDASASVTANYHLTVPAGAAGGTYTTTVYYLAVIQQ